MTGDVWTQSEAESQEDIISRRLHPDTLSVPGPGRGISSRFADLSPPDY